MVFRSILPVTLALALSACGAVDDSPLMREQTVKLAPGDTYSILQGATQMAAAAYANDELSMVSSTDGYQEVRISYRWHGREIVTQKLRVSPGMAPNETKLAMELSPSAEANADDRRKFARIKDEQGRKFLLLGKMLNSQVAAELFYGPAMAAGDGLPPRAASLSGQTPQGKAPVASLSASAPTLSTEPALNPTASVR